MSSAAEMLDDHRELLAEDGEDIIIRRFTGTGNPRPKVEATVRARVTGYAPEALVGTIVQGDRRIIALVDPDAVVPSGMVALTALLPLNTTSDRAVVRDVELKIKAVDDNTRRVGGVLVAIEMTAAGGG